MVAERAIKTNIEVNKEDPTQKRESVQSQGKKIRLAVEYEEIADVPDRNRQIKQTVISVYWISVVLGPD
jgi:hypothetical protein